MLGSCIVFVGHSDTIKITIESVFHLRLFFLNHSHGNRIQISADPLILMESILQSFSYRFQHSCIQFCLFAQLRKVLNPALKATADCFQRHIRNLL